MKAMKVLLALLLGGGAVAAYWYFPNPMESQAEALQAPAGQSAPAAGGEST